MAGVATANMLFAVVCNVSEKRGELAQQRADWL